LQECIEQARRHGYVQTMLGRRRPIPEIESNVPARRSFAERTAINSVVQGSAADLIKLAMVDVFELLQDPRGEAMAKPSKRPATLPRRLNSALVSTRMLLQIHDELVFECPEADAERASEEIVRIMENAMTLSVPRSASASGH